MINFEDIVSISEKINKNCKLIDKMYEGVSANYAAEEKKVESDCKALRDEMKAALEKFEKQKFQQLKNKIKKIIDTLESDYKDEFNSLSVSKDTLKDKNFVDLEKALNDELLEINSIIKNLNNVNFDELVLPTKVKINSDKESFYTYNDNQDKIDSYDCNNTFVNEQNSKPIKDLAVSFYIHGKTAILIIDALEKVYEQMFDIDSYNNSITSSANVWLSEKKNQFETDYRKKYDELFDSVPAQESYKDIFCGLEQDGKDWSTDMDMGSLTYNSIINIGRGKLVVDNNKEHIKYINKSMALKEYVKDGFWDFPVLWNLQEKGSLLLTLENEDDSYSDETIQFVNQLVLQVLLSFPANRVKFNLVDIGNKMGFSPFKALTKINTSILMDGIIRDDRKLDDSIKDIEQMMYSIEDDKISINGVKDIFEYNKRFETAPQDMHLFVLVDSPSGLKSDTAKRVMKIIQNGSKCGIFTIVIQSKNSTLDTMFKFEDYKNYESVLFSNSLCIFKESERFSLGMMQGDGNKEENNSYSYYHVLLQDPDNKNNVTTVFRLPDIHNVGFYPYSNISIDLLPKIVENLSASAEANKQKVIPLQSMFDYTDAVESSGKNVQLPEHTLDIPIGLKGGDVQTLRLMTSGGSAHAVVIGGTGSGKSNLLHAIIMNACYRYSPEDLNFYLVDFKGGVEFKFYEANGDAKEQLPHIRLTGLTSDLSDGVSILVNLEKELHRREDLFRHNGVEDIIQYKKNGNKLARLVVLIDEIQELFERDEVLGQKAIGILSELVKKGRAFGINILWASQNVPHVPGLKVKVLSQIGNKISLRLNNPEDAQDLDLDIKAIKGLNRPEKGLGVINDERYGNDTIEFRVAFAESSESRKEFVKVINKKWQNVIDNNFAPLFIVGSDAEPSPIEKGTYFSTIPTKEETMPKAFELYTFEFGQDYITGKPYQIGLKREDKENLLFIGTDVELVRDMMGYALLSVIKNQATDSDYINEPSVILYANGEMLNPANSLDLFNVIRSDYGEGIENVSSTENFINAIKSLNNIYLERAEIADKGDGLNVFVPYYMVIHSIQRYVDIFNSNKALPSDDVLTLDFGSTNPFGETKNNTKGIADVFKDLFLKGGKFGIHFIISVDNPTSFSYIKKELLESNYIMVTKGTNTDLGATIFNDIKTIGSINSSKVALVKHIDEKDKIRVYRYEDSTDSTWYKKQITSIKKLLS